MTIIEKMQQIDVYAEQYRLAGPNTKTEEGLKLERKISKLAHRILEDQQISLVQKEEFLQQLLARRMVLITNQAGFKDIYLDLNLIQNIPPTPLCPAYRHLMMPTVTSYHSIGPNLASIRLDPSALRHVPREIIDQLGDLSTLEIDLFYTMVSGFHLDADRSLNLGLHAWTHHHMLAADGAGDGQKRDVLMGIFPILGVRSTDELGSLTLGALRPMQVHTHGDGQADNMLYSPDNAHFDRVEGSPFSAFWAVAKDGNRVCVSKMLVVYDHLRADWAPRYPISQALLRSIRDCQHLGDHLEKLHEVTQTLNEQFAPLCNQLENPATTETAMETFHALPLTFQNDIYYQTWLLHGSPLHIHRDFGRASFEHDPSLSVEYYSNTAQKIQAIQNFAAHLNDLLVTSQQTLLNCQTLDKGDNVIQLMKCAHAFTKNDQPTALARFNTLDEMTKGGVYFSLWEIAGCQNIANFGETYFHGPECSNDQRTKAILLAASRLTSI